MHLSDSISDAARLDALALANQQKNLAEFLAEKSTNQNSEQEKADILLLAHDFVRYEFLAQRREKTTSSRLSRELLRARSAIVSAHPPSPVPTLRVSPEQGHATGMLQLGIINENNDSFLQLRLRPAYHDQLDNDDGYVPGAQIDFLNIALRYRMDEPKLELDEFTLVDIISLSPRSRFFNPFPGAYAQHGNAAYCPIRNHHPSSHFVPMVVVVWQYDRPETSWRSAF